MGTIADLMQGKPALGQQSPTRGQQAPTQQNAPREQQNVPSGPAEPMGASRAAPDPSNILPDSGQVEAPASDNGNVLTDFLTGDYGTIGIMRDLLGEIDGATSAGGATNRTGAATAAAADSMLVGAADSAAGGIDAMLKFLSEGDTDFSENYEQRKTEFNKALEMNRVNYPGATIGGDITGAVIGGFGMGGAAAMAAKKLPLAYRAIRSLPFRFVAAPAAAGGEAALYRWNSDGTAQEIKRDAAMGVIAGAALSNLTRAGGFVVNRAMARGKPSLTEHKLGQEIYAALTSRHAVTEAMKNGVTPDPLDPAQVAKMIQEAPEGTVIADLYPELHKYVDDAVRNSLDSPTGKQTRLFNLLAARNNAELDYADIARRTIKGDDYFTPTAFVKSAEKTQKSLQPQYEAIFNRLDGMNVKVKGASLLDNIKKAAQADPGIDTSSKDWKTAFKTLKSEIKANKSPTGGRVRGPADQLGTVNPRAVHNIKRKFGKMLGDSATSDIRRNNALVYGKLNEFLGTVDEDYAKLSSVYADVGKAKDAYKLGNQLFNKKMQDPKDFFATAADFKSAAEGEAFVHGARAALYDKVKNKKTAKAMFDYISSERDKRDLLNAVLGEGTVDEMFANVTAQALQEKTTQRIAKAASGRVPTPAPGNWRDMVTNMMIASKRNASGAAKVRAGVNVVAGGETGRDLAAKTALIDDVLTAPAQDLPQVMQRLNDVAAGVNVKSKLPRDLAAAAGGSKAIQSMEQTGEASLDAMGGIEGLEQDIRQQGGQAPTSIKDMLGM